MCCTAWSREARGGAGKAASGMDGKRLLWGQPILDVMHNHILEQLGFVSIVPRIAWWGDEDEEEYLQWTFIAQKPPPDEGTIGLGHLLLPKPFWPTKQDLTGRGEAGGEQVECK